MLKQIANNLHISVAIEYLSENPDKIIVTRESWKATNRYLFMRPGDTLSLDVALNAKSIPTAMKEVIKENGCQVLCTEYICEWIDGAIINDFTIYPEYETPSDWIVKKLE